MVIWKTITGFSKYEISDYGHVRNIKSGRVLAAGFNRGYKCHILMGDDGGRNSRTVHRLVCITFNGLPVGEKNQVNHIDGNKLNNHRTNLEWCTTIENNTHAKVNDLNTTTFSFIVDGKHRVNSLKSLAELLGFSVEKTRLLLASKSTDLNKTTPTIEIIRRSAVNKSKCVQIYCIDFEEGRLSRFESIFQAAVHTGLNEASIRRALGRKKGLTNGLFFWRCADKTGITRLNAISHRDLLKSKARTKCVI